ncbi:MAG: preprotein translocase subunit SecG [Candidatus Kerfeldbacteria bacterium CG08_land_8_20_14_0_20_43_14]|uniref:Protein-export membrane protein SecG n=1 Tax=Candidatus Kerfeldbacteria bacterium CG08_land_8_20_14_0_20_43_14 TaxID=2014246 RepID=A0A2H0YQI3_9BACT|nr:MAG: preprotein translocase subunit SecG [Candidatus Kerfeldbacteria bacterium CG08_land_8_20_14_0_20_43_14]
MLIKILSIAEIVTAVLITIAILMQAKGAGLGAVFGGEGNVYRTKRGAEKILFYATIVMGVIFAGTAIAFLILQTGSA